MLAERPACTDPDGRWFTDRLGNRAFPQVACGGKHGSASASRGARIKPQLLYSWKYSGMLTPLCVIAREL